MAKKKSTKKVALKVGDYVRVRKGLIGVVSGFEEEYDDATGDYTTENPVYASVAYVESDGESNHDQYAISRLTKIPAPQYVVVWSDEYSDPFCQFETRADADKFANKLRKNSDVVEVRTYKLTK